MKEIKIWLEMNEIENRKTIVKNQQTQNVGCQTDRQTLFMLTILTKEKKRGFKLRNSAIKQGTS